MNIVTKRVAQYIGKFSAAGHIRCGFDKARAAEALRLEQGEPKPHRKRGKRIKS